MKSQVAGYALGAIGIEQQLGAQEIRDHRTMVVEES